MDAATSAADPSDFDESNAEKDGEGNDKGEGVLNVTLGAAVSDVDRDDGLLLVDGGFKPEWGNGLRSLPPSTATAPANDRVDNDWDGNTGDAEGDEDRVGIAVTAAKQDATKRRMAKNTRI